MGLELYFLINFKMFSYIFGKPKVEQIQAPPPPRGPSQSTLMTLKMLSDRESDLDKRITSLAKQVDHLTAEAIENHKSGAKTQALIAMKKKVLLEEQIKTNTSLMMKLIEQKSILEGTIINSDTLAAINHATHAMQAEQSIWGVDKIKGLHEKTEDVYATHREINDLLLEPIISGPTEEDLLEELNELANDPKVIKHELPVFPEVPTTVIGAAAATSAAAASAAAGTVITEKQSDDMILKELQGLIAS